jgi:hypothetical protein
MPNLQSSLHMAQEMGARLGECDLLFGAVPPVEKRVAKLMVPATGFEPVAP